MCKETRKIILNFFEENLSQPLTNKKFDDMYKQIQAQKTGVTLEEAIREFEEELAVLERATSLEKLFKDLCASKARTLLETLRMHSHKYDILMAQVDTALVRIREEFRQGTAQRQHTEEVVLDVSGANMPQEYGSNGIKMLNNLADQCPALGEHLQAAKEDIENFLLNADKALEFKPGNRTSSVELKIIAAQKKALPPSLEEMNGYYRLAESNMMHWSQKAARKTPSSMAL